MELDFIHQHFQKNDTLPETNSSYLKMDGWKMIVSFWEDLFSGAMLVSGRVYIPWRIHGTIVYFPTFGSNLW